jgi:pyrroline-5-carboxylate reductase
LASLEPLISSTVTASLSVALEGLEQGAIDSGMPERVARIFGAQALLGTTLLMADLTGSPAELKDRVASPGGTTIAGLAALEDRGARGVLMRAVENAVQDAGEGRGK